MDSYKLKRTALDLGFDDCGIIKACDFKEYGEALANITDKYPETGDIYKNLHELGNIKKRNPWAKSIVVCIRSYNKYAMPEGIEGIGKNYLFDSRIPQNPDYKIIKDFTGFLKSESGKTKKGGVPDRLAAAKAGIADIGKNNFAYTKKSGSYINIVSWITDIETENQYNTKKSPCPEGCSKCQEACPTGALAAPYLTRMDKCVAYLTYEAVLPLKTELSKKMNGWVYGCDICQDVCPLNRAKWQPKEELPHLNEIKDLLTLKSLSIMTQQTYEKMIHPYFWYIPITSLNRWHLNARRAIYFKQKDSSGKAHHSNTK